MGIVLPIAFVLRMSSIKGGENAVNKRYWIIPFVLCVLLLLADGVLFCVALATPTWKGPWGRYLAKGFLLGAVGFGLLGTVLLIVYLIKKR